MVSRKSRKGLLRSPVGTRIVGKAAADAVERLPFGEVITGLKSAQQELKIENRRQDLLDQLFGTSEPICLLGSDDHPQFPLLPGELVYPSDRNAAQRIREAFFKQMDFKEVTEYVPGESTDSLIALGSSVATPMTRRLLGDPRARKPRMRIWLPEYKYEISLHFNHVAPDPRAPLVENFQEGREMPWQEYNWGIVAPGREYFPRYEKGRLVTDYLLVTRIPSPVRGAGDILMFGGCHGAGTQATELLLTSLDYSALENLISKVGRSSHFQALFLITDISHEGHSCGHDIHLVDAKAVLVRRR
ncbi:MAG: hypothetical protein HY666_01875 [Chloroflexi bacterium]|nr:hypothetical protein [Chloroflexota bacterium]